MPLMMGICELRKNRKTKIGYKNLILRDDHTCGFHIHAPVAQLDRVSDSDSEGRAFESHQAYQSPQIHMDLGAFIYLSQHCVVHNCHPLVILLSIGCF